MMKESGFDAILSLLPAFNLALSSLPFDALPQIYGILF
jgi:hypothetical protein